MERIHYQKTSSDSGQPLLRSCGTTAANNILMEKHPFFRTNLAEIEENYQDQKTADKTTDFSPVTIQVVVHVVYHLPVENISDLQVQSQIEVLNRDFGATNPDKVNIPDVWKGLPRDSGIRFVLATQDPEGKPTNGISRTKTEQASFGQFDTVKFSEQGGIDAWPTDRYLNIWVCNLSDGLLGYAQFPGGPIETDGVVILYRAFGTSGTSEQPFNLGRTCTHEVGHYLNLRHIWGDTENCLGTDFVDDTPIQQLPNYNKPTFPHISCNNGPNGDMYMNYMDYVDDDTMIMFTPGQIVRMQTTLSGPRASLTL
jgi:hypothetical protein